MDSGEDSDGYVMRMYRQMIDNESMSTSKNNSSKSDASKPKNKGRPKSVAQKEENERKKTNNDRTDDKYSNRDLNELSEENRKLKQLLEQKINEGRNVINKASELKQKDKTSSMQVLELLKLNVYLISHLPDSERILEEYLSKTSGENNFRSITTSKASKDCFKSSTSKQYKSSVVNPISNYFKSVDKNGGNGHNYIDSDTDADDKPLNKFTSRSTRCPSKSKRDIDSEDSDGKAGTSSRRVSPRKNNAVKTNSIRVSPRKRINNKESDNEDVAKDQNVSTTSMRSSSGHMSSSETNANEKKQKKKESAEKPKRKRRRRVEEPKGLFPCTYDPRQCDEIMDTKEHYDFHMSGHFDAKYVCPYCAYTGPTIQIIKRHLNKEREAAIQEAKEGKRLTADRMLHKDVKIYQCFGCKVCDQIHDKLEKCEHIKEDADNRCHFMHDMDYEFKDHLKMHFADKFRNIKDKEQRKQKIKTIVDKFVDETYFENNAKKELLIEKFNKTKDSERKNTTEDKEQNKMTDKPEKKKYESSDSDWD